MPSDQKTRFEDLILPHLDSAYNLARWLTRNEDDARDVVQEACLRAFRFFGGFRGEGNGHLWLLTIVRNTSYSLMSRRQRHLKDECFDEERHVDPVATHTEMTDPLVLMLRESKLEAIRQSVESLTPEFREIIVLREIEGMSYHEIANIVGIPVGTVMSRLSRARTLLQRHLQPHYLDLANG